MKGLSSKVVSSVMVTEAIKISKNMSKESSKGLRFLVKSLNLTSPSDFSKHSVDMGDPLQKMVSYALQKASSRRDVREMVGQFAYHYNKKNLKGMAKALDLDEEVVGIVLLSYLRNKTASRSKQYKKITTTTDRLTDAFVGISSKSLSLLDRFIEGGAGFLLSIFPETVQNVAKHPLKWATIAALLYNSWWILGTAGSFSAKFFAVGWGALATFSPLLASLLTIGVTATSFYFMLEAFVWTGDAITTAKEWSAKNTFDAISLPFQTIWSIFRAFIIGTYKLARWAYNEVRTYFGLFSGEFKAGHLNMKHISGGEMTNEEVFDELMLSV